jgi:hypothetical protein
MSTVLPFRINTNINGIPAISSQSVSVNTAGDRVSFDFLNHRTTGGPFRGWITVRLAQNVPTGTATTAELFFTSEGGNATPVYGYDNVPATVANLRGSGIYLFWYEGNTNYLQLVTGNFI